MQSLTAKRNMVGKRPEILPICYFISNIAPSSICKWDRSQKSKRTHGWHPAVTLEPRLFLVYRLAGLVSFWQNFLCQDEFVFIVLWPLASVPYLTQSEVLRGLWISLYKCVVEVASKHNGHLEQYKATDSYCKLDKGPLPSRHLTAIIGKLPYTHPGKWYVHVTTCSWVVCNLLHHAWHTAPPRLFTGCMILGKSLGFLRQYH